MLNLLVGPLVDIVGSSVKGFVETKNPTNVVTTLNVISFQYGYL